MSTPALELQRRLIRAMSPEHVQDAVRRWFRDDYSDADPERHLRDIAAMRRISGGLIDQPALEGWIARLGLDAEWRKALETE